MRTASRHLVAFATILLLSASLAWPANALPGDLDPAFGTGGRTVTNVASPRNFGHAVAVQPDGKAVVAGTSDGIALRDPLMAVSRFNTNGTLDTGFGTGGTTVVDMGARSGTLDMLLQDDGKIVMVGFVGPRDDEDFAIARLTDQGQLDDTFSGDGKQAVDFYGAGDTATSIARNGSNYFVGGTVWDPEKNDGVPQDEQDEDENFGLTKLSDTGAVVASFGENGRAQADIGTLGNAGLNPVARDLLSDVVVQGDGKIIAGGSSEYSDYFDNFVFALVRFTATGGLDPTFDGDGRVVTEFSDTNPEDTFLNALKLHEGMILAVGHTSADTAGNTNGALALARYSQANGSPNNGFGTSGKVMQGVGATSGSFGKDLGTDVLVDAATDKITVAGSDSGLDFALARFNSNGTLDTSAPGSGTEFGTGGIAVNELGGTGQMGDQIHGLALDPTTGKLVVTGVGGPLGSTVVARYSTKGVLDSNSDSDPGESFGTRGYVTITWGGQETDHAQDLIELESGKLLGVGYGYYGGPTAISAVRYNANGTLDPTYGTQGISRVEVILATSNNPLRVLEMSGGKVILVTSLPEALVTNNDVALIRLNENGGLDTSFGNEGVVRVPLVVGGNDVAADAVKQANGKIVIAGTVNNDVALIRVHPNGSLDTDADSDPGVAFSTDGKVVTDVGSSTIDRATAVIESDSGGFYLGAKSANRFAVLHYSSLGELDGDFGTQAHADADFPQAHDVITALAEQDDEKIIAAGWTSSSDFGNLPALGADIALARFNPDGSLDDNSDDDPGVVFGNQGLVTTGLTDLDETRDALLLDDERILVIGRSLSALRQHSLAALYTSSGALDSSFGTGGSVRRIDETATRGVLQDQGVVLFGTHIATNVVDLLLQRIALGPGAPPADRTMSLKSSKTLVVFGDKVKLSGTVTSDEDLCRAGVTVDIDPSIGASLQVDTDAAGTYARNHTPKEKTTYVAALPATGACGPADAGPKIVKVAKAVTLEASKTRVDKGDDVTLTAQLAPCAGKQGQDMTLKKKTTGSYVQVGTKAVNDNCKAKWTQTINKETTFQAVSPKQDAMHEAGRSAPLKVKLR